jgi:type II secretory pathway pseudopilin PulG
MKAIKNSENGYTLVELLAVMIILIAVGTIIASIFVSSLRGGNKSTTTNEVRQVGNYVISQMSKMIAFSEGFSDGFGGVGTGPDKDNITWYYDCVAAPPARTKDTQYHYVKIVSLNDGDTTTFECGRDPTNTYGVLSSNSAALTPSTMDATCSFTCSQADLSSPPTINISLKLKKIQSAAAAFLPESQKTTMDFNTSVTLRNKPYQ